MNFTKKYYLNNISDKAMTISLSKSRTIKPLTSLSLNNKDVQIIKNLKNKLKGKKSFLDNLVLSTIRIEDDSNYKEIIAEKKAANKGTKDKSKDKKAAEAAAKKELEAAAKKEAEEAAKKELEEAAKKELEEAAKKEDSQFV